MSGLALLRAFSYISSVLETYYHISSPFLLLSKTSTSLIMSRPPSGASKSKSTSPMSVSPLSYNIVGSTVMAGFAPRWLPSAVLYKYPACWDDTTNFLLHSPSYQKPQIGKPCPVLSSSLPKILVQMHYVRLRPRLSSFNQKAEYTMNMSGVALLLLNFLT
jgi:hypothetical protein